MAWRDSFVGIANRGVDPKCAACGSGDTTIATGIVCAQVLCNQCGHVALFKRPAAKAAVEPQWAMGLTLLGRGMQWDASCGPFEHLRDSA